ncbi:nucleoside triphosphate pyrophosphohydrolase [Bacillus marinisedimentorum]|uniref:nucleoside triphosphate pyrophosphohydrolase n=1 Tax=Bacillus marinisedimentorum TaxID=1821260 RepID=UPI00087258FB|nr:nucleoside triphosphate pyrophosphohydrolase [Bacillus marinisedimentorum]
MARTITVAGLGAGDADQMTVGVYRLLTGSEHLFLRTKEHPAVQVLEQENVSFVSFDEIYEQNSGFEDVYREITDRLFAVAEKKDVVYAVPGHPLVAEKTVQMLLEEAGEREIRVRISGGQSFLDPMFAALGVDPVEGFQLLDATDFRTHFIQMEQHVIITQVYDAFTASEVKLGLMEKYPDDYEIVLVTAAGSSSERIKRLPLFELDREAVVDNLTSVYVPPVREETLLYGEFSKLREVIAALRGPDGCPWDKKQTHESLKKYLVEETYEVLEAIDEEDDDLLADELGDVLLQVMLHAQIGEDEGWFSIRDVILALNSKMIRRHPHVFGEATAENAEEVVENWEAIKKEEKGESPRESLLDGIPKGLPGLYRAYELQKKAAKVGFDWDTSAPVWEKVSEETEEFRAEIQAGNSREAKKEFGDLLFALVNLARYYKIDPEDALRMTNEKFRRRFRFIEESAAEEGKDLADMSLDEMDEYWNKAKSQGY